jgi:hypothetical protein
MVIFSGLALFSHGQMIVFWKTTQSIFVTQGEKKEEKKKDQRKNIIQDELLTRNLFLTERILANIFTSYFISINDQFNTKSMKKTLILCIMYDGMMHLKMQIIRNIAKILLILRNL